MKKTFYEPGKSFKQQKLDADKKHVPLYMKLKLRSASPDLFFSEGPIEINISAGALERCRRLYVSESLMDKLALGSVYRVSGATSYMADPRIIVRLRWQDSKGYFANGRVKRGEPLEEHVFSIPEDLFLKSADVAMGV